MTPDEATVGLDRLRREALAELNATPSAELAAHADEIAELFADFAEAEKRIRAMKENRDA